MSKHRSYSEKLKDPRWQKVRLLVLERAGWACEGCGTKTETLHVHHGYYERRADPWEYDMDTLWCLCEDCHEHAESVRRDLYLEIARLHPTKEVSPGALKSLAFTDRVFDAMQKRSKREFSREASKLRGEAA